MTLQEERTDFMNPIPEEQNQSSTPPEASEDAYFRRILPPATRSLEKMVINGKSHPDMILIQRIDVLDERSVWDFMIKELSVSRLNAIHDRLWLAGRAMPPRPLNYQVSASRAITATEDINYHLVWEPGRIFIKPLPGYLFDWKFWDKYLVCKNSHSCNCLHPRSLQSGNPDLKSEDRCERRRLYKFAYGLLYSYTSLIQYESDFNIALGSHLIPSETKFDSWHQICSKVLQNKWHHISRANERYQFGELRVSRLNAISRFRGLRHGSTVEMMRGYKFEFATYGQQLESYQTPILASSVYILMVLTAMQVGLATKELDDNSLFHSVSYGFTVFAIIVPPASIIIVLFVLLIYIVFNYISTQKDFNRRQELYQDLNH